MKFKAPKKLNIYVNQSLKINGMDWSPNNLRLAVACEDRNIYLFDEQGNYKENFSSDSEVHQIVFSPESTKLAVVHNNNISIYKLGLNSRDKQKNNK